MQVTHQKNESGHLNLHLYLFFTTVFVYLLVSTFAFSTTVTDNENEKSTPQANSIILFNKKIQTVYRRDYEKNNQQHSRGPASASISDQKPSSTQNGPAVDNSLGKEIGLSDYDLQLMSIDEK